ncbi:MAG: hypothetical protein A3B17_00025 [Candidatus Yanofskybacteria bacterium RIFCSPLOWO2_01_FULL_45_72]|nr:MAG: hypothetical protein A3B17_00025 [Candidatus Yanofskybacteria bacterium RIFCSPLOWO2_01_FULL_45_72]
MFLLQRRQNFFGVVARQRNFLKKCFDLRGQLVFLDIVLFLAYAFLFRASVVSVSAAVAFCVLRGNGATARNTFHKAKKSKVMFFHFLHSAALCHNFLAFIKKFL